MTTDREKNTGLVNATVELSVWGKKLRLDLPTPTGSVRLSALLPLFRSMTDTFVALAVEKTQETGATVSCQKGCGACCRQLVPIAPIEAQRLRDVVQRFPEPRKSTVLARFKQARPLLQAAGLLEKLLEPQQIDEEAIVPLGLDYFRQGIACPFLEAESCSIYTERPLACREYLVTSPAAHCAHPTEESVQGVKLAVHAARAVRGLNAKWSRHTARWLPLILALDWAETHHDDTPKRPGTQWAKDAFARITGQKV